MEGVETTVNAPSSADVQAEEASNAFAGIENGAAAPTTLTVRALVSTKEAGIIIGKGGQNVAELREKSGVKAGVSKVIQGVHDRVLSITGSVEAVALVRNKQFHTLWVCMFIILLHFPCRHSPLSLLTSLRIP